MRKKENPRICDKCGSENGPRVRECKACGSTRFAPGFVRQLRKVNRNFYVQVTEPPAEATDTNYRLTLYKWWPGNRSTFNINTNVQWESVKNIVDNELAPFLNWRTRASIQRDLGALARDSKKAEKSLATLAQSDPKLVTRILKGIDLKKISLGDPERIADALSEIANVYVNADVSLRQAIRDLVQKLPTQGEAAIRELSNLMESLTLHQITAVASEVRRRVGLLKTFKERALDDRTYEIYGSGSIHRLLESAMWIVDERYWLMHSNSTLRTVIGRQLASKDRRFESKRPDFVCGAVDNRLIVIELKRPSHLLTVDDLNQLERYVVIAQEYDDQLSTFEAILVGKKMDDELRRVLKLRGARFRVLTFATLIDDTERRYEQYLKELDVERQAKAA